MHYAPPKISLWLEDAIAVAAFAVLLYLAPFVLSLERGDEKPAAVRESCAATIQQYGPAERWAPNRPPPVCVASLCGLPNHVMTYPLGKK